MKQPVLLSKKRQWLSMTASAGAFFFLMLPLFFVSLMLMFVVGYKTGVLESWEVGLFMIGWQALMVIIAMGWQRFTHSAIYLRWSEIVDKHHASIWSNMLVYFGGILILLFLSAFIGSYAMAILVTGWLSVLIMRYAQKVSSWKIHSQWLVGLLPFFLLFLMTTVFVIQA